MGSAPSPVPAACCSWKGFVGFAEVGASIPSDLLKVRLLSFQPPQFLNMVLLALLSIPFYYHLAHHNLKGIDVGDELLYQLPATFHLTEADIEKAEKKGEGKSAGGGEEPYFGRRRTS